MSSELSDCAVRVERLGKRYRVGGAGAAHGSLRESLVEAVQRPIQRLRGRRSVRPRSLWALRDVDFEIAWGEVLGVIGRNGAGKSTLLKILSRVTYPTAGRAQVYGRVGALLEVGTGFHDELTGRENVFLNGAILGMRRSEIRRRFDEIIDFAEIERFLDTPVKRYSSGMYMRLAFSIAAHLEPEILVVDEVLAVGDAAFQKKCLGKMGRVAREGRTILFVSHNMPAVEALCHRAVWLDRGNIVSEGAPQDVVRRYLESQLGTASVTLAGRRDRSGDGSVQAVSLDVEDVGGDAVIRTGSRLRVRIGYRSNRPVRRPQFIVSVGDQLDVGLFVLHSEFTRELPETLPPSGFVTCETEPLNLAPGRCIVHVEVMTGNVRADFVSHAASFDVHEEDVFGAGIVMPDRAWARYVLGQRWVLDARGADELVP